MAGWKMQAAPGLVANAPARLVDRDRLWQRLLLAIRDDNSAAAVPAMRGARKVVSRGDIAEFEPFFSAHERDIFTYLWRMTSDEQAAYDLSQETFLRAWRRFATVRDYDRPGGWLFRVATHLALNYLRSRTTSLGSAVSLERMSEAHHARALSSAMTDPGVHVADADTVRRTLMAISPRHRAALVLREVYGLSGGEVATSLGISVGAAKTLLWRARDEFRSHYAEEAR